jgi:hypothetical protein
MDTVRALAEAEIQLEKLTDERDMIDRKIKGLVQVIDGLRVMSGESAGGPSQSKGLAPIDEIGLTDAVRNYFKSVAAGPVFPVQIRDALIAAGYYGNGPQGILLAVHSILGRMEKRGEVDPVPRDGKTAYEWVSLLKRAVRKTEEEKKKNLETWKRQ